METQLEIQLEIEPITPETSQTLKVYSTAVLKDLMQDRDLQQSMASEPQITFEQRLPLSKEQLEMLTIGLAFVFKEGPNILRQVKTLVEHIVNRLSKKGPTTASIKLRIGNKKIEASGLSPEDTLRVVTEQYEMELHPSRRE